MSRDDGFAVMDVSTSIHEDPKFRALARRSPELIAPAFLAYVATMAESWREGERQLVTDAWPTALIPFDRAVVAALKRHELLEKDGRIASGPWEHWFEPASRRQQQARERWRRANEKRHAETMQRLAQDIDVTASLPRGNSAATATTDRPTDPTVRPSDSLEGVRGVNPEEKRPRPFSVVNPVRAS